MKKALTLALAFLISIPTIGILQTQAIEICIEVPETIEISAVYPTPSEGEEEWIELINTGSQSIDLSYFTLEDATEKPMSLNGTLAGGDSIQITNLPFQLNNGGDTVTLKISTGDIIDVLIYDESYGSEETNNDEVNLTDETEEDESSEEPETISTPNEWPIFSEAMPNPSGSDSTDEWIELYNPYTENLSLTGLYLDDIDGGSSPHTLEGEINAEAYLLISIEDSHLTLNNSTDSIRLLGVNNEILWEVTYEDPEEDETYAAFGNNKDTYSWTNNPSPGAENEIRTGNEEDEESEYENGDLSEEIDITEVFPNPEGPDQENEWIEITNGSDIEVNLGNWTVDDGEGGSAPYTFPDDTIIGPGETIILYRPESGIALNNSDEIVQISDYTGEIVDEIGYESSVEGQSYAKIEVEEISSSMASTSGLGTRVFSTWQWSSPSPGDLNPKWKQFKGEVISFENSLLELTDGLSTWEFQVKGNFIDEFLFQTGNSVLVQANTANGIYNVMHSELLKSASPEENKTLPWGFIGSIFVAGAWLAYESYKKHKKPVAF